MAIKNQKQIQINKKNKEKKYSILNHSSLIEAMSNLSDTGLRLWLYFYINKNGFTLQLYQSQVMGMCNFSHGTYYKTIKELINKNYLRLTNPQQNLYTFYETSDMKNIENPINNQNNKNNTGRIINNDSMDEHSIMHSDIYNNHDDNNTYKINNNHYNQEGYYNNNETNNNSDMIDNIENIDNDTEFNLDNLLTEAFSGNVLKDASDINKFFEDKGEDPIDFTDEDFNSDKELTNEINKLESNDNLVKQDLVNDNLVNEDIDDNVNNTINNNVNNSVNDKETYGLKPIKDPITQKIYPNDYEQYQIDFIEKPMEYNGKKVTETQYWELRNIDEDKKKQERLASLPKTNPINPNGCKPSERLSSDDEMPDLIHNRYIKYAFDYFQTKVKKPVIWKSYREYHKYIKQIFEKTYMNDNKNKNKGTYQDLTEEQINAICQNMVFKYTEGKYKDKYKNDFLSVLYSFSIQDVLDQYNKTQKFLDEDAISMQQKQIDKQLRRQYYIQNPDKIPKPIVKNPNQFSVDFSKEEEEEDNSELFDAFIYDDVYDNMSNRIVS